MTSPYLDLPRFSLADTLKAGVKASLAIVPSTMLSHPDHTPAGEDYRHLARRLRELARERTGHTFGRSWLGYQGSTSAAPTTWKGAPASCPPSPCRCSRQPAGGRPVT
jgi:hypothetical protein